MKGDCTPIKDLLEGVGKKSDINKAFNNLVNNNKEVDKIIKFFNELTENELNALKVLSELFKMQMLIYRNDMTIPESYAPKEPIIKFHIALQWDEGSKYCYILYKDETHNDLEKLNKRLVKNLLQLKKSEVDLAISLTDQRPKELEFKVDDDILYELREDCKKLKNHNKEHLANQLGKIIDLIQDKGEIEDAIKHFLKKREERKATNAKGNNCLICFEIRNEQLLFNCSHKICQQCYKENLNKRSKEALVLTCIFPDCYYVLKEAEQKLIKFELPEEFKESSNKCGMCDATSLQTPISFLHEKHGLCKRCLKSYVEEITQGKVYIYENGIGALKTYPCPFIGCEQKFGYELVEKLYSFEDNKELLRIGRKEFIMIG